MESELITIKYETLDIDVKKNTIEEKNDETSDSQITLIDETPVGTGKDDPHNSSGFGQGINETKDEIEECLNEQEITETESTTQIKIMLSSTQDIEEFAIEDKEELSLKGSQLNIKKKNISKYLIHFVHKTFSFNATMNKLNIFCQLK